MTENQQLAVTFLVILGIVVFAYVVFEYVRFRSWDRLEDEVDEWRESPSGRFQGYLDGLTDTP